MLCKLLPNFGLSLYRHPCNIIHFMTVSSYKGEAVLKFEKCAKFDLYVLQKTLARFVLDSNKCNQWKCNYNNYFVFRCLVAMLSVAFNYFVLRCLVAMLNIAWKCNYSSNYFVWRCLE